MFVSPLSLDSMHRWKRGLCVLQCFAGTHIIHIDYDVTFNFSYSYKEDVVLSCDCECICGRSVTCKFHLKKVREISRYLGYRGIDCSSIVLCFSCRVKTDRLIAQETPDSFKDTEDCRNQDSSPKGKHRSRALLGLAGFNERQRELGVLRPGVPKCIFCKLPERGPVKDRGWARRG